MNKETILGMVRHALTFGGGALASKGLTDDAQSAELVGALMTVIGIVWSIVDKLRRNPAPAALTPPSPGGRGSVALVAFGVGLMLVVAGCGTTRLETGGAYAPVDPAGNATVQPDFAFYATDAAFDLAYSSLDGAFKFEADNRALLWKLTPSIKHGLDQVRPQASDVAIKYALARRVYLLNPVPANLAPLQGLLAKAQQLGATALAVLPTQKTN